MILYLSKKYVINTLVFAGALLLFPVLARGTLADFLASALFWGSVFAAGYTYRDFQKRNLWPLYDNLRLPRFALLAGLFLAIQLFTMALAIFL